MNKVYLRMIGLLTLVIMVSGFSSLTGAEEAMPAFQQLDRNQDGYLSQEEAQGCQKLAACFAKADSNQDNQIDQVEYAAVIQAD